MEKLSKLTLKMKGMLAGGEKNSHFLDTFEEGETVSSRSVHSKVRILLDTGLPFQVTMEEVSP